ncbi:MAG: hypothetical protein V4668_04320 [Patescibacteria group bacterium]
MKGRKMQNNESSGTLVGVGFVVLWAILAVLYDISPFLPLAFLTILWGVTLGLAIGLGGNVKWVLLQCIIFPSLLVYQGFALAGWQGSLIGLLQFANMLDFALMIGFVVWLSSWKIRRELTTQVQ